MEAFEALKQWSSASGLLFNPNKSFLIRFHRISSPNLFEYSLNDSIIPCVSHGRDLGIIFSCDLSWSKHYEAISKKAYNQLYLIKRRFSSGCPSSVKRMLYIALVRSQLTYCSPVWRPMFLRDIIRLEKIQRRATKFIVYDSSLSYRERLISLNLMPLMYFYEYIDLVLLVHSLKYPDASFDITSYIKFSSLNTRSNSKAKLLFHYAPSNASRHYYFNRIPRLWNALPPIDLTQSFSTIKMKIREILWSHFLDHFDTDDYCTYHVICPCLHCHTNVPAQSTLK